MPESTRAQLKQLLAMHYAHLVRRLTHAVGSRDRAADALHETWLRLEGAQYVAGPVANTDAYILGIAHHVAVDQYRSELRHLHEQEVNELFQPPDELADPERIVAARRKIDVLKDALQELPPRQRTILWAARVDGMLNREIAEHFGMSLRTVERELGAALQFCSERMKDPADPGSGYRRGRRKF